MNTHSSQKKQLSAEERGQEKLSAHIFTVSASMVGVCLAVIGLFQLIARFGNIGSYGDDLLALDALLFLAACVHAYLALRSRHCRQRRRLERTADALFLLGLGLMTIVCLLITYTIV